MPNFKFKCNKCSKIQDAMSVFIPYGEPHPCDVECETPKCKGKLIRIMETSSNVVFKGLPTPKHYGK